MEDFAEPLFAKSFVSADASRGPVYASDTELGDYTCPTGMDFVTSEDDCRAATTVAPFRLTASDAGWPGRWQALKSRQPTGTGLCFEAAGQLYFNDESAAGHMFRRFGHLPVCKKIPGWNTGPVTCTSIGGRSEYGFPLSAHMPNLKCDGKRLTTLPPWIATSADTCNTACVRNNAVAWTWNNAAFTCKCKKPPLSDLQHSEGDISGVACS